MEKTKTVRTINQWIGVNEKGEDIIIPMTETTETEKTSSGISEFCIGLGFFTLCICFSVGSMAYFLSSFQKDNARVNYQRTEVRY